MHAAALSNKLEFEKHKTSYVNGHTNRGHEHKAPDRNYKAT